MFTDEDLYRIGDQVVFWDKNKYGYNLCHRGVVEQVFNSDKIAYVRTPKDDRQYAVEFRNIERIVE